MTRKGFILVDFNPETHPGEFGLNSDEIYFASFGLGSGPWDDTAKTFRRSVDAFKATCESQRIRQGMSTERAWLPNEIAPRIRDAIDHALHDKGYFPVRPMLVEGYRPDSADALVAPIYWNIGETAVKQLTELIDSFAIPPEVQTT